MPYTGWISRTLLAERVYLTAEIFLVLPCRSIGAMQTPVGGYYWFVIAGEALDYALSAQALSAVETSNRLNFHCRIDIISDILSDFLLRTRSKQGQGMRLY